jgi:hypothetical protein
MRTAGTRSCMSFAMTSTLALIAAGCGGGAPSAGPTLINLSSFQAASVVIGQPTFTASSINQGGSAGANTLYAPYGSPTVFSGKLFLPDYANNRVLGFDAVPAAHDAMADFVLGQPSMGSTVSGSAANQLMGPQTVKSYNGRLLVDEYLGNRVLIWNSVPTSTQAPADVVVGQAGFGTAATSCTATGLNGPESIETAGGKLIVADKKNSRVLIWNSIPASNGTAADVVVGQNSFTTCAINDDSQTGAAGANPTARTLNWPGGVWSDGTKLVVSDTYNNRVLIWNSIPTANFAPADVVLGQGDFTHREANDDLQSGAAGTNPTARTLNYPYFLDSNGVQLFLADAFNNRVLIWDSMPTANFAPANRVLGQGDFTHGNPNDDLQTGAAGTSPTARTLFWPSGVYLYGTKLFVADSRNNRALVFDSQ